MVPILYIAIESRGRLWIDVEGKPLGPFASLVEACHCAIEAAHIFGTPNRVHEVRVRRKDGRYATVWSSARDSYPPEDIDARCRAIEAGDAERVLEPGE